jgi:hypothetical protein
MAIVHNAQKHPCKNRDFLHKNILTLVDKCEKIVYNSGA